MRAIAGIALLGVLKVTGRAAMSIRIAALRRRLAPELIAAYAL
ncbi:MAG: hypothetical protein ACM3QS_04125 [Bacteroidota bacterium]